MKAAHADIAIKKGRMVRTQSPSPLVRRHPAKFS